MNYFRVQLSGINFNLIVSGIPPSIPLDGKYYARIDIFNERFGLSLRIFKMFEETKETFQSDTGSCT